MPLGEAQAPGPGPPGWPARGGARRRLRAGAPPARGLAAGGRGPHPKVVAQSSQWDFLLSMAESGMGTAVLPQPLLQRLTLPPHLVVRALPARELSWVVAHVWATDRYLGHAVRAWLACCGVRSPGGRVPPRPVRRNRWRGR
ncbi:LysR substrate-binding domain-containing protein [Aquabacterium sp.]|uniref:LysR substrate-binding domain-containing protein n=1 Tax=Aquabacterium sp. TaxID=1872578 RepID=UPI003BB1380D